MKRWEGGREREKNIIEITKELKREEINHILYNVNHYRPEYPSINWVKYHLFRSVGYSSAFYFLSIFYVLIMVLTMILFHSSSMHANILMNVFIEHCSITSRKIMEQKKAKEEKKRMKYFYKTDNDIPTLWN